MVSAFVESLQAQPATVALIAAMAVIFLWQFDHDTDSSKIGQEYERQLVHGEWWRVITSTYSHLGMLHILFNMMVLWQYGSMEAELGTLTYLRYSLLLALLSHALLLAMQWALRRWRGVPPHPTYTVGYSGVIFGWLAAAALLDPRDTALFGVKVNPFLMIVIILGITHLVLPQASFTGHLSGILVGLAIGGGGFRWFDNYLALCTLIWVLVGMLATLKLTGALELSWIQILEPIDQEPHAEVRMVNGEIVYPPGAAGAV